MARGAVKRAKLAVDSADIGVIDITIDEISYLAARQHLLSPTICSTSK
jgi:hypothetical protein